MTVWNSWLDAVTWCERNAVGDTRILVKDWVIGETAIMNYDPFSRNLFFGGLL